MKYDYRGYSIFPGEEAGVDSMIASARHREVGMKIIVVCCVIAAAANILRLFIGH
jgi:hypothetical protein